VILSLLASLIFAANTTPPSLRAAGIGTPLLVVTDAANAADPFGPYLGEILRTEGFTTFQTADVSALPTMQLADIGIILLGSTATLSAGHVTALTNYVQNGGRLIAMRPPAALASLFGVTPVGSTTVEPYMKMAGIGLSTGFNTTPLQVHPAADNYTLAGATAVAALYSSFANATAYAAVTSRLVGQGQAMLWAYDLAQSVVYTRQSNPSRASEHDGVPGYRTTDLFAGYADLNDVPLPQADEQQRLLAKAIETMSPIPLPRLWYFPRNAGAVLVLTGDAHANPTSYFTNELNSVQKYGGHISFDLAQAGTPSASDVAAWKAAGHGVGIHPYVQTFPQPSPCADAGLQQGISDALSWFQGQFGVTASPTLRIHDFAWQCWSDAAAIEAAAGLQMDTSFYTWGPWLQKPDGTWAHGYLNGSGLPMQMSDATGNLIPIYQQTTALIDEQLIAGVASNQEHLTGAEAVAVSKQLLDASLSGGNYAAVTTQFQVDDYASSDVTAWAEGTMAYAQSQGVPLWSAEDWLRFTKARANTTFGTPSWDGSHLGFTLSVPSGPDTVPLMVPLITAGGRLSGLTVDGSSATYQTRTVKGVANAVASVPPGSHSVVATYAAVMPSVTAVTPATGPTAGGTTVTISGANFDPLGTVTFGGVNGTNLQVNANGTSLTVVSPSHAAAAVDVAVSNPGDRTATMHNAFTYVPPPTITAISPQSGSTAGGGTATITGTGFQPGASVTVGGSGATGVTVSADGTRITMILPPHGAGSADVVVTNPDGQRGTMPAAYTYGAVAPLPNPTQATPAGTSTPPSGLPPPRPASGQAGGGTPNPVPAHR
jgi:hypothetical protein